MQKSFSSCGEVYLSLCKRTDTPISLGLWLRYKYSSPEALKPTIPIRDYLETDTARFKQDYACASYLKKYKGHKKHLDISEVALSKFNTAELECAESNKRLKRAATSPIKENVSSVIYRAKQKIAKLLGPYSLFTCSDSIGWGPGATFDIPRKRASVDTKMLTLPITISPRAVEYFDSLLKRDLRWSSALLKMEPSGPFSFIRETYRLVDDCRVELVDKDASTKRTIAVEPTGNLYAQKGVGAYFRSRLKMVGINLDDQTVNQSLAETALRSGLSTIDLRAASDTVCRELVFMLLPLDWALFLDSLRSHWAFMPDKTRIKLEKFSSMGNGFTFELESIIFWALGSSIDTSPEFSVYGDDIICRKECAHELIEVLQFCGFTTNADKSYVDGLFYESCGRHFFNNVEVTPPYQKELVKDLFEAIRAHNRLFRWDESFRARDRYRRDYEGTRYYLPACAEGDTGFLLTLEDFIKIYRYHNKNYGYPIHTYSKSSRILPGHAEVLLADSLRRMSMRKESPLREGYTYVYGWDEQSSTPDTWVRSDDVIFATASFKTGSSWVIPKGWCPIG